MNEEVLKLQVQHSLSELKGKVLRICDALRELDHMTHISFNLCSASDDEIDSWLNEMNFSVDPDGYYHSLKLLEA